MTIPYDHLDKLLETAKAGRIDEFRRLVLDTLCIDEIHPITHQPIVETLAAEGLTDIVRYLIEQGASLDSACHGAARGGLQALMNEFLDRGADKNLAVQGAAIGGHFELMWSLIRIGASRDLALAGASENGEPTVIQALIDQGADKFFALAGAIKSGDRERIRSSLSYSNLSVLIQVAEYCGQHAILDELKAHCNLGDFPELEPNALARGGYEGPFLQRYGEQSQTLAWGISGAAMGGHVNFMNRLIEHAIQFALLNEKTALKWAVYGAAAHNHTKLVDHLIARGATIEDALLGANFNEHDALTDRLIALGIASGRLRKDHVVLAVAVGKRYDLVNAWVAEGASLNQALRGVCSRGENIELAKQLIAQGASAEWVMIGWFEGVGTGIFEGEKENLDSLIPKPRFFSHFAEAIHALTESGHFRCVQIQLEKLQPGQEKARQKILDKAVAGAARGGFRTMVTSLLDLGATIESAMEGAVRAGDRFTIETLLDRGLSYNAVTIFFKTACATAQDDLIQWMGKRLKPSVYDFTYCFKKALKLMTNEEEVVQALSMIQDSHQQLEIARGASVVHLITAAQIVKQTKVSPRVALALAKMNGESLRCFLAVCHTVAPAIPRDVKLKLFSFVAASEGFQIPERDVPDLMRASNVAIELAKFNEISTEEAEALAKIQKRLNKFQKKMPNDARKSSQLASAAILSDRTHALCLHRHRIFQRQLLPRSMQVMMQKFEKYQNLSALKSWIKACADRLQATNRYYLVGIRVEALQVGLCELPEFTEETYDPTVLARYLLAEHDGNSLYSILKTLPYWKDCAKHFPNMEQVLEESVNQQEIAGKTKRSCF